MLEETTMNTNKLKILNRDQLKYIALIFMGIGHMITFIGVKNFDFLPTLIVRLAIYGQFVAPPIFFFFITEGYVHTRSRKQYALRLAILAVITQIPYYLCEFIEEPLWHILTNWSVIMTLFAGVIILMIWDSSLKKAFRILLIVLVVAGTFLIQSEWFIVGPIMILEMYLLREKPIVRLVVSLVLFLAHLFVLNGFTFYFSLGGFSYFIAETVALLLITFFYNGEKGRFPTFSKWVFYVFYPAHLFIAFLIILAIK